MSVGFTVPTGIACDDCDATEQDCARNYPPRTSTRRSQSEAQGGSRTVAAPRHTNAGSHPCGMVGCDRTFDSGQGRALHERRAHETAA